MRNLMLSLTFGFLAACGGASVSDGTASEAASIITGVSSPSKIPAVPNN